MRSRPDRPLFFLDLAMPRDTERSSGLRRPVNSTLRLGTRASKLAMTQSGWVAQQVRSLAHREVEPVEIATLGDLSAAPIEQLGGTGVFVTALRDALLRGEVDFGRTALLAVAGLAVGNVLVAVFW